MGWLHTGNHVAVGESLVSREFFDTIGRIGHIIMRNSGLLSLRAFTLLVSLIVGAIDVRADTVLLNESDVPQQNLNLNVLHFTADSTSTTITFEGYQVPDVINVDDVFLFDTSGGPNLLGRTWASTQAFAGTDAHQVGPSPNGVNGLDFGGNVAGFYDTFSQTVHTVIGDDYTVEFFLTNPLLGGPPGPSALIVTVASAPEPGTLVLLCTGLAGFGGFRLMRKRKPQVINA